jgi:hypothetical protein
MSQTSILTPEQRERFERTGLLRFEGLFTAGGVARARAAVLRPLEALGVWRDGGWRLDAIPRPRYPDKGLNARQVGNKHPEVAALAEEPAFRAVVHALLEGRPFDRTLHPRPQVLFTLPNAERWTLPEGWHSDAVHLASGARPGVQMFGCLGEVAPGGGGTVVVAGSHRLGAEGRPLKAADLKRVLVREPFFRDLYAGRWDGEGLPRGRVGEVELEVVELTGAPGDVWLIDLRIQHSAAPNAAARPRMMVTDRYVPTDLLAEMSRAYGWA